MIHYTLLPEREVKVLRREYRLRLFIIILFFISISLAMGILSLLPSYVSSEVEGTKAERNVEQLKRGREERGADQVEKELKLAESTLKKVMAEESSLFAYTSLQNILSLKVTGISLLSFDFSRGLGTSSPPITIISGKASTREALLLFKEKLEGDLHFSKVELPISDLAKNKDITFALRLTISK